tara:strand:+ start:45 stop:671 length:627 start_codon:yes stop_codon:yes gene_type:complete
MKYLAIDTTTLEIKLAIYNTENQETFQIIEHVGRKHSEKLHIKIKEIIETNNLKVSDLNTIVVNLGPGSYTSLRLGIATAKGLALPFKHINVVGVDSFKMMEELYAKQESDAIMLENNASQLYLQTNGQQVIIAPEEVKDYLTEGQKVFGTGFEEYKEHLTNYDLQENTGKIEAIDLINYAIKHDLSDKPLEPLYIKPLTYKKYVYKL